MAFRWVALVMVAACAPALSEDPIPRGDRGFIRANDRVDLAFRVEGKAPDTVIVLHGGPGLSGESLRPDLQSLSDQFTLIFYDQRGSGHSTAIRDARDASISHHVADVEAVRQHFGLERVVLAGHSWGAGLALHYALAHPQRTDKLLLIDPMPLRRDPHMADFARNLTAWMDSAAAAELDAAARARANAEDPEAACEKYWSWFIRGYLADPMGVAAVRGDLCHGRAETIDNRIFQFTLGSLGSWDWRADAAGVRASTLIVYGDRSPIPIESILEWEASLGNATLVPIAQSGHWPHAEQPTAFVEAVSSFLRE